MAGKLRVVEVDSEIFDDVFLEACTRVVELNIKENNQTVSPYMETVEVDKKKVRIFNTYKILVNAGYHGLAKKLRNMIMESSKIDLMNEPIQV